MNQETLYQHRKEIIASIALLFIALIVYSAVVLISHIGKIKVDIHVVPSNATVTMDNLPIGTGTQYISAGTYTFKATRDGFSTSQSTTSITTDKTGNDVALALTPQSDEAKKWASSHQSDYDAIQIYGGAQAQQTGQLFLSQNPIIGVLPYQDPYYEINYRSDDNQHITLTIQTESPRYRYMAVQKIRELGYNPTDFRINFVDFHNPLGAKQ